MFSPAAFHPGEYWAEELGLCLNEAGQLLGLLVWCM